MSNLMATIEVGKLPWIAALFLLANWKTGIAAVWGLGFAWILARKMRQWYKDDARDAAVGMKDEEQIFANMKVIAKERRSDRLKTVFKRDLFWLPWLAFGAGKKLGKIVFYPLLAYLDKAQTEGLEEGKKGKPEVKVPLFPVPSSTPTSGVLTEGVNATKCNTCGFLIAHDDQHVCHGIQAAVERPRVSNPARIMPVKVECSGCGERVEKDRPHACSARLPEGMVKCECGTVYKKETDFDHVCPEEADDEVMAQCKDCETEYDATKEIHVAKYCRGCTDVHCTKYDCGERVTV